MWFEIMQHCTPLTIQSLLQTCKDINVIKDRIWTWKAKQMNLQAQSKWEPYLNRCIISRYYNKCFFCLISSYIFSTNDYRYQFSKAGCVICLKCKDKQLKKVQDKELKRINATMNDLEFFLFKRQFIREHGMAEWIHYQFQKKIKKSEQ